MSGSFDDIIRQAIAELGTAPLPRVSASDPTDQNYDARINQAAQEQYKPGGNPSQFMNYASPVAGLNPLVRWKAALDALVSGQENEQLQNDNPRLRSPLDRANYPGS